MLLKAGADTTTVDSFGYTGGCTARVCGFAGLGAEAGCCTRSAAHCPQRSTLLSTILCPKATSTPPPWPLRAALFEAVRKGNDGCIKLLLDHKAK